MSADAIADAKRALANLHGPDQPGANTIRKLNEAAFLGERYAQALVADWEEMREALHLIATDPGAEKATRLHAARVIGLSPSPQGGMVDSETQDGP